MPVTDEPFGRTADGRDVERWTLTAGRARLRVLTLGGIVQALEVPDVSGTVSSVVLGFPDVAGYRGDGRFAGSIVGRVANRIAGGRFVLDGTEYSVPVNDGPNALHGGEGGFWGQIWTAAPGSADGGSSDGGSSD